ncbi:hypothetical protein HPC49_00400 [Pyxidicoccus fallax]|uniref:Uncharacterized protein n=1 Tax=Pyxidicoccus fallax TaxID=394095 RepID=A0A848L529_9BACT|nr:hypothetical protein [Pyxidicoccus fallax]NMO13577.1 hypothetical protein [Pyxidicoccus fallax]NPC76715.1 hypothetical protein [Pyxidicoccus fallax]
MSVIANGPNRGTQWRYGTVTYGPSSASISSSLRGELSHFRGGDTGLACEGLRHSGTGGSSRLA